MEDYYEYLDSNGVTTLYKLIKDDTVALIDSYTVTINGITTTLDTHINNSDIHTPIADIENMVDTKISGLVNSAPETLDTLKELSDALGNDPNFATTVANQIGTKASKDSVYTKQETDTLLEGKANSVHSHVVSDITDFPTIPTKTSELTNDSGYITNVTWEDVIDKPELSQVAISGSYSDLNNTPTIPTKLSQLENDTGFINALTNVVDTKSNQTINGIKMFTDTIHKKNSALDLQVNPSSDQYNSFLFTDKNNAVMGYLEHIQTTSGVNAMGLYAKDKSNKTHGFQVTSEDNVIPIGNGVVNLGLSGAKWKNVYATTFNGNLKGNADTATSANDPNAVHKTGNETISGVKSFNNLMYIYDNMSNKNSQMDLFKTPANTLYSHYMFVDKNNEVSAYMQYGQQNTGTDFIGLFIHDKTRALHGIQVTTNNEVIPIGNNTYSLGSPNNKWANVYSTNAITNMVVTYAMTNHNDTSAMVICGGTAWDKGSTIFLYGSHSNYPGAFDLTAKNTTNEIKLIGFPDGTLTWGNRNLTTTEFVKGTNYWYRKHSDGFIEMGGIGNASIMESYNQVTLPTPFSNTNYVVTGSSNFRADIVFGVSSKTATYFHCGLSQPGITWVTGTFSWYACGY